MNLHVVFLQRNTDQLLHFILCQAGGDGFFFSCLRHGAKAESDLLIRNFDIYTSQFACKYNNQQGCGYTCNGPEVRSIQETDNASTRSVAGCIAYNDRWSEHLLILHAGKDLSQILKLFYFKTGFRVGNKVLIELLFLLLVQLTV